MPTECQILRSRELESDNSQQHDTPTAITRRPSHPIPPAPALNDLIRALENSPPDNESPKTDDETDSTPNTGGDIAKVSDMASGLIRALENSPLDNNLPNTRADTDATHIMGGHSAKISAKASRDNASKKRNSSGGKKATVSDDDDKCRMKKKMPKMFHPIKPPIEKTDIAEKPHIAMMDDFISTIDDAVREQRIDEKKAERLHECLQSGDWSEVAFSLLCEQIPLKRKGKGYSCRVCLVPKKGHTCLYCHICSTPEEKFKKDDEHVCSNCPLCFEDGKKKKKLIQIKREGHVCPHEARH